MTQFAVVVKWSSGEGGRGAEDKAAVITTQEGKRRNCYHSRAAASGNPFHLLSVAFPPSPLGGAPGVGVPRYSWC